MAGIQAVIAEAFVSAIIKAVIKTASSYFSDKHKEHQGIEEMLDSLKASLPRVRQVLSMAEHKPRVEDANLAEWLQQLKDVIYEADDVMDDFAAIRIQDSLRNKGKVSEIATSSARAVINVFLLNSNEQNLMVLLRRIKEVCDGFGDLTKFIESGNKSASDESIGFFTRETSSFLSKTKKIFGRDKEIELILDMMITENPDETESTAKNDVTKRCITDINISEEGKEMAESSDPLGATEENVNPIRHKFSSCDVVGLNRPSSGGDQFHLVSKKPKLSEEPKLSNPTPKSNVTETTSSSKEPKLSNLTPKRYVTDTTSSSNEPKLSNLTPQSSNEISISVGEPSIRVLPIVGISGIGKTTIAQVIYNHSEIKEYFDLQGWVYVTDSPKPKIFLYTTLCSFDVGTGQSNTPITSLSDVHDKLKRAIQHKRFLLVFDDVREGTNWINSTWKKLIEVLAYGARGSTAIVTTDSRSTATLIGTLPQVYLDYLPPEQFLELFEYFAFGYNMMKSNLESTYKSENHYFSLTQHQKIVLKPIGEKIAEKLHGLPLAAEVIGTLLNGKTEPGDWEMILESDWWDLEVSKHIITPLGVGFQNLDSDLKQCFIYCSLFPRNYVFDKDKLVQMWIAHGFIQLTEKEREKLENEEILIEDIGRSKFDKLVDKFFFQIAILKNKYVMHDLIRELAIAISSEMLYVNDNSLVQAIPSFVRHLAIDPNKYAGFYVDIMKWNANNMKNLRTIMFFGFTKICEDEAIQCVLYKLSRLRLLDLSYSTSEISLSDMGKLSHLRFLDLSFSGIREIPKSLCDLVHLQVLDMRGCYFFRLPDKMHRLINLRHLYACPDMISLIRGIGRLTNLQELEVFRVKEEEGFTISELADLKTLNGHLTLTNIEEIPSKEMAISAKLEEKKYLKSLKFDMARYMGYVTEDLKQHQQEILEGLKPHKNIRELSIENFSWVSFPSWVREIQEMNNLMSIQLERCWHLEILPPFGSLPALKILNLSRLDAITNIGKEFYGTSDVIFPSLTEITFHRMEKWEIWSDPGERKHFPCLQKLKIEYCYILSETPLSSLNSVVDLHLSYCDMVSKSVAIYFAGMTSLTRLYLGGSRGLKLDLCCDHLRELQVLTLRTVDIVQLEGQISSLLNLKKLKFSGYTGESDDIKHLPAGMQTQNLHSLPSLVGIEFFKCRKIPAVLFRMGRFPSLRTLRIDLYYGENFTLLEDNWLQQLSSLEDLELSDCQYLRCLPDSLSILSCLKKFTLKDCPEISSLLPEGLPQCLVELYIINCKSLMFLPPSLSNLFYLKKLFLKCCPRICSLPQEGLPQSLLELYIIDCPAELMQGCQPNTGAEWFKISHVPCIRVKQKISLF